MPFRRVQAGDRGISAASINEPQAAIERMQQFYAPGASVDFGVPGVPVQRRPMLLAQITAGDGSLPRQYSWSRFVDPATTPANGTSCDPWPDLVCGGPLYFTPTWRPAYEIGTNQNVPIGAIVELWPSENGECLFFFYPPLGNGGPVGPAGPGGTPGPTTLYGNINLYGVLDVQGGIVTSPAQTATKTTVATTSTTTQTYTVTVVSTTTAGTTTTATVSGPGPTGTPTPANPLNVSFTPQPSVYVYVLYQGSPGTPGLIATVYWNPQTNTATGTNPDGSTITGIVVGAGPTITVPVTQAPDTTKQPPSTPDTTSAVTTSNVLTTGLAVQPLPTPPAPTVYGSTTAGSDTISYTAAFTTAAGTTTPAGPSLTVNGVPPPSTSAPISVSVSLSGIPKPQQQGITVTVYATNPNNTGRPNGPIGTASSTSGAQTDANGNLFVVVADTGQPTLFGLPQTPPASNTTGSAALTSIAGSLNLTPLATPGAPTVSALTTGAATDTYGITAIDSLGNSTALSPTTTITNGAASPDNFLSWSPVPGAYQYGVWRTAGGATQGLLATVAAGQPGVMMTYTDNNATGSGATAPATNATGALQLGGSPGTAGQVATSNGPNAPPTWQAVAGGGTATEYTGTTTDAFATVFDYVNNNGVHGSVAFKNTGASNSMNVRLTFTNMFGTVTSTTFSSLVPTNVSSQVVENATIGVPPIKELKLEIQSTTAGQSTTYDIWRSFVG